MWLRRSVNHKLVRLNHVHVPGSGRRLERTTQKRRPVCNRIGVFLGRSRGRNGITREITHLGLPMDSASPPSPPPAQASAAEASGASNASLRWRILRRALLARSASTSRAPGPRRFLPLLLSLIASAATFVSASFRLASGFVRSVRSIELVKN